MCSGRILKGIGGFYYVKTENTLYECKARGIFRKEETVPLPGDVVNILVTDEAARTGIIEEILPRSSILERPSAANADLLAAVIASHSPDPDYLLLDKLLITAGIKNISAIIIINKIDLDTNLEHIKVIEAYGKASYKIIPMSSVTGEGFEVLKNELLNRITVFAGQSGVGKSTILNRIMDSLVMDTGDVSRKIQRGKHTTRHAELLELSGGGYVIDTPGFSSFELSEIEPEELYLLYPEFKDIKGNCRFSQCAHISEPDCVVKSKLDRHEADIGRYSRYIQLYKLLKENKTYRKKTKPVERK